MLKLRYGNTNTFLITGRAGYLLIDTDYAGTLPAFYRCIKQNGVKVADITYVLATHYHPDHMGLIPELMKQGVKLLMIDTQVDSVHFSDYIFARDRVPFEPIDEAKVTVFSCPGAHHRGDSLALMLTYAGAGAFFMPGKPPRAAERKLAALLAGIGVLCKT